MKRCVHVFPRQILCTLLPIFANVTANDILMTPSSGPWQGINFVPIKTFVNTMSQATITGSRKVRDLLFPFTLALGTTQSRGYVKARAVPGTIWSLAGMGICVLLFTGGTKIVTGLWPEGYE